MVTSPQVAASEALTWPPSRMTWLAGRVTWTAAIFWATSRPLVMTVMPVMAASSSARMAVVLPASTNRVCPACTSRAAARAMARFSLARTVWRTASGGSACPPVATMPPCTRRSPPSASSARRSRRTVSRETPRSCAMRSVLTWPREESRPRMRCSRVSCSIVDERKGGHHGVLFDGNSEVAARAECPRALPGARGRCRSPGGQRSCWPMAGSLTPSLPVSTRPAKRRE